MTGAPVTEAPSARGASWPRKEPVMATGTIKTLRDRGFGFIARDGGDGDLFFHRSAVEGIAFDQLQEGQRVSFDEEPDPREPGRQRAVNVKPTSDAS